MNNLKITSIRVQILNQDLQNKTQEHYPCDCNIRSCVILFMTLFNEDFYRMRKSKRIRTRMRRRRRGRKRRTRRRKETDNTQ